MTGLLKNEMSRNIPININKTQKEYHMSVQNVLKKPAFGKNVMGYSISEVDKYITYVTERYNSVCAESAELKRRVIRLQLMLDETNAKLAEAEKLNRVEKPLDKSALSEVFAVLDAEKKRTAELYEELKTMLNKISEEKPTAGEDYEWEEVLNSFIESVPEDKAELPEEETYDIPEDVEDEETSTMGEETMLEDFESFVMAADDVEEAEESELSEEDVPEANEAESEVIFAEAEAMPFSEDEYNAEEALPVSDGMSEEDEIMNSDTDSDASYEQETEMLLKLLQGTFNVEAETRDFDPNLGAEYEGEVGDGDEFDDGFDVDNGDFDEEADADPEAKKKEKTPAEMAAELDFYTDSVYRDGESFDPMTLAHNSATSRKPKYDDFFTSDFKKSNKK